MLMKIRAKLKNQKGFTLIELMVVIAIIGILAAIAIPRMSSATDSAKTSKIQADLRTLGGAVATFNARTGADPATANALEGNEITLLPVPPTGAGAAYAFRAPSAPGATPVVTARFSCSFGGKTYYSDGTAPTTP